MARRLTISISLLLWLLLVTISSAQTDTTTRDDTTARAGTSPGIDTGPGTDMTDDSDYLFWLGLVPALSIPLRDGGLGPGDPIYLLDSMDVRGSFAMTYSFRLSSSLMLEFVVDGITTTDVPTTSMAQRRQAEATYPDYFLVENDARLSDLIIAAGGLSYRMRVGPFMLEPLLMVGYGDINAMNSSLLLKRRGGNEYRSIHHNTSEDGSFVLLSAMMLRYAIGSSRWGMQLRASYFHTSFDIVHTITDESTSEARWHQSFTARHTIQAINIGLGAYYRLF